MRRISPTARPDPDALIVAIFVSLNGPSERITGVAPESAPAAHWPRAVIAVLGANQPGYTGEVCCLLVLRARPGFPSFRSRIRMRMKRPNDHMVGQHRGIGEGESASCSRRRPSRYDRV